MSKASPTRSASDGPAGGLFPSGPLWPSSRIGPSLALGASVLIFLLHAATARSSDKPAITALAFTPDGQGYVQGSQSRLVFRPLDGKSEKTIASQLDHVHALAFSPDGKLLAIAGGSPAEAGYVEIVSWPDGKRVGQLEKHDDVVYDVCWLPGGKALATASGDRTVRIWNADTRQPIHTLRGHSGPVLAVAVSPDGKLLCSGSGDQTIRVWDPESGKVLRTLNNHLGAVHSLAFRPGLKTGHAELASTAEDGTLRIWQPAIGRLLRIVRHGSPTFCVGWSADGAKVHTGAKDGVIRTVDGESDEVLSQQKLEAGWPVSLAVLEGRLLVGTSRGEVK